MHLPGNDEVVVKSLISKFLFPPSPLAYNLRVSTEDVSRVSMGQAQVVDKILGHKVSLFLPGFG